MRRLLLPLVLVLAAPPAAGAQTGGRTSGTVPGSSVARQRVNVPIGAIAPGDTAALDARYGWLRTFSHDTAWVRRATASIPYDSIQLERQPCYGPCPAYTLTFRRGGAVTFHGARNAARQGDWRADLGAYGFAEAAYAIERLGVTRMDAEYTQYATDLETTIIRVWRRGERTPRQVRDYGGAAPLDFRLAAAILDALTGEAFGADWKPAFRGG
jgi:hypothetical protein